MTQQTNEVEASFGGRIVTFCIYRPELGQFEQAYNIAAVTMFERFNAGRWSVGDVSSILNWAAPDNLGRKPHGWQGDADPLMSLLFTKNYLLERAAKYRGEKPPESFVDAVLLKNGPAKYAPLAHAVLAAALFGLPADAGTWSDEEEEVADAHDFVS